MDVMGLLVKLSTILVIIGALNWGLVGIMGLDLVSKVFGEGSVLSRVIFILVGLSGLYMLFLLLR
jgi:uncharacterized membrane protein YuzA (DUF378 family)